MKADIFFGARFGVGIDDDSPSTISGVTGVSGGEEDGLIFLQ